MAWYRNKEQAAEWLNLVMEMIELDEQAGNSHALLPIGFAGFVKRMIAELLERGEIKFSPNHGGGREIYDNSWNVKLMGFELQVIGVGQEEASAILGLQSKRNIELVKRHRKEARPLFALFGEEANKQEFWNDYFNEKAKDSQIVDDRERHMLLTRSQSIKELLARDEAKEDDPDGNIMKLSDEQKAKLKRNLRTISEFLDRQGKLIRNEDRRERLLMELVASSKEDWRYWDQRLRDLRRRDDTEPQEYKPPPETDWSKNPFTREGWDIDQQGQMLRADRERTERLAKEAGTTVGGGRPPKIQQR